MPLRMRCPTCSVVMTQDSIAMKAYGFESSNLPDGKPEDGCLSVTWEKDGEIHSGTLNLLDNKISIKEIGGDYLEVTEQASQKNGE